MWCGRGRTPKWMAGHAREDFLIVPMTCPLQTGPAGV
ncbi:hypothetical protein GSH06_29525 [Burkholderia pseudomallei]|nr:hypothetical protein [Burkholderia pseudomallei]